MDTGAVSTLIRPFQCMERESGVSPTTLRESVKASGHLHMGPIPTLSLALSSLPHPLSRSVCLSLSLSLSGHSYRECTRLERHIYRYRDDSTTRYTMFDDFGVRALHNHSVFFCFASAPFISGRVGTMCPKKLHGQSLSCTFISTPRFRDVYHARSQVKI